MKPETLEERLLKRIDRKRCDVFLRADFEDLGGYDQVGRGLGKIVREGRLVRVGQGLYARARPSMTSGGSRSLRSVVAAVVGTSRATGPSRPSLASFSVTLPRSAITAASSSLLQAQTAVSSL